MKLHSDPRHKARELTLKTLFEWMFYSRDVKEILEENIERLKEENSEQIDLDKKSALAEKLVNGIVEKREEIDGIITECAPEWPIDQIAQIDLAILRIAVFELILDKKAPPKAVVDEAVELGKDFGGDNSSKFVNGVLGTIMEKYGLTETGASKKEETEIPSIP